MTTSTRTRPEREELIGTYLRVRAATEALCESLEVEDMVVQTMPDVSPVKWHLAHTTWFFEKLALERSGTGYAVFDDRFHALFNSYYQSLGDPFPRDERGLLSRPTVREVREYRRHVDAALIAMLEDGDDKLVAELEPTLTIGVHHEQQHQELLLMDAKHVLSGNPSQPAYRAETVRSPTRATPLAWCAFEGRRVHVGASREGFAFDNERPRHAVHLRPFELASRLVTAGEFLAFMEDGGYERSGLWLADGWDLVQREGWRAPLYWDRDGTSWSVFTLGGRRDVDPAEPVCHVSYYEADAYATWAGCRLPSELEWEHAAADRHVDGRFLDSGALHPLPLAGSNAGTNAPRIPAQLFGDVWEWTSSSYAPYPGYEPFHGELAEYNGKFMINQLVLRGGCCATPRDHVRHSYRNFYGPGQRWMFAGFRLAK